MLNKKSESKEYQIRFNTNSKTDVERWRLIENGNEIIVADIIIDGHTHTTKDWMEDIQDWKWHISCVGHCEIRHNIAYITTVKEESVLLRHVLKTMTYRVLATIVTVVTAYSLGASLALSSLIGVGELLMKPVVYFLHERAWYKFLRIGRKK